MRIYGIHSGRNNMNRLLARSIMFNSRSKGKKKATDIRNTDNNTSNLVVACVIVVIILIMICCR